MNVKAKTHCKSIDFIVCCVAVVCGRRIYVYAKRWSSLLGIREHLFDFMAQYGQATFAISTDVAAILHACSRPSTILACACECLCAQKECTQGT